MAKLLTFFSAFIFLSIPVTPKLIKLFFADFKDVGTNIILNGNAEIQKPSILKLTNDTRQLMGEAFYNSPFKFKNCSGGKG